jgi:uncharacterized membrane protein
VALFLRSGLRDQNEWKTTLNVRQNTQSSLRDSSPVPGDMRNYAEIRRRRIEQCREHRARYLEQRGVLGGATGSVVADTARGRRRISLSIAAGFLSLVTLSALLDATYLIRGDATWAGLSYRGMAMSAILGFVAIAGSVVHWWSSRPYSTDRTASATLALGSALVSVLVIGSFLARPGSALEPGVLALLLGFMAAGIAIVTGGIAGELLGSIPGRIRRSGPSTSRQRRPMLEQQPNGSPESVAAQA